MAQIGCAFVWVEEVEEAADLAPGLLEGAHVGLAQERLQFGEDLFDRFVMTTLHCWFLMRPRHG